MTNSKNDVTWSRIWFGIKKVENKLNSTYDNYKNVSKRKIYWHLWEKERSSSKYNRYEDFKKDWTKDSKFWSSIGKDFKSDIKKEIKELINPKSSTRRENIGGLNQRIIENRRINASSQHYTGHRHHKHHRQTKRFSQYIVKYK